MKLVESRDRQYELSNSLSTSASSFEKTDNNLKAVKGIPLHQERDTVDEIRLNVIGYNLTNAWRKPKLRQKEPM